MDMQAKIAARRTELESQSRESQRLAAERVRDQQASMQAQREQALDKIGAEVSQAGLHVHRQGDRLQATSIEAATPLDFDGLKRSAIDRLLGDEARKMWTPAENWQVIAVIVSGVFLTTFYGVGLVLILVGILARNGLNRRYKAELSRRYPEVFPNSPGVEEPERLSPIPKAALDEASATKP